MRPAEIRHLVGRDTVLIDRLEKTDRSFRSCTMNAVSAQRWGLSGILS
jgi:hypothetical protein